jgi:hypothetical protein
MLLLKRMNEPNRFQERSDRVVHIRNLIVLLCCLPEEQTKFMPILPLLVLQRETTPQIAQRPLPPENEHLSLRLHRLALDVLDDELLVAAT